MAADTRDRIVYAAMKLFAEKGFASTSVADILQAAGVNSGSLYHFFPGKQEVLLAVLEAYRTGIGPMLLTPAWEGIADPIERVFALLRSYRRRLEATEYLYGCPIGSIALELHEPDPPVRELLDANFDGWVDAVEQCLVAAGDRLPRDVDRRALATLCLSTMEGGVMLSRTARTPDAFDAGVDMFRDYLRRLEAPPLARKPLRKGRDMLNGRALLVAASAGTVAQVAMVVTGHFSPAVKALFAVGGMGISLLAGVVYGLSGARQRGAGTGALALGGLLAGAICAVLGILVSFLLGDVPATLLALGTSGSAVTGAIGGLIVRLVRRPRAELAALVLLAALPTLARAQVPAGAGACSTAADPGRAPARHSTAISLTKTGSWEASFGRIRARHAFFCR